MRIAGWSGPRNLSTAMMYAFAARGDCDVADEPFYAAYLDRTGLDHPMRGDILDSLPVDPGAVVAGFPVGAPHRYLKLMAGHMLDGMPLDWAADHAHLHLIRHPARVVASYAAKRDGLTLDDIGYVRQLDLYERFGGTVIDSADIRARPEATLRAACDALEIPFTERMLSWPAGGHAADGVWAAHWYAAVHRSTGFAAAEGPLPELDGADARLAEAAMPYYERMARDRLSPD